MSSLSNYLENKILDHLLRGQTFTPPATVYIGLDTATSDDASGGTEVTGGSYARVAVASSLANWNSSQGAAGVASSGADGTTENAGAITFPAPTANWGVVTGFRIWDAATGGNALIYQALTTPKTINSGDTAPSFGAGALSIQIDN